MVVAIPCIGPDRRFLSWRPGTLGAARLVLLAVVATGCASNVPEVVRRENPAAVPFAAASADAAASLGKPVRWGGVIVGVENRSEFSILEVLERPLDGSGRPSETAVAGGRFLVRSPNFLDPMIYAREREVTVIGRLQPAQRGKIGEFGYDYPVVAADTLYLWEPRAPRYADPYWYDPWYPWWRPYPYWPYRHPLH